MRLFRTTAGRRGGHCFLAMMDDGGRQLCAVVRYLHLIFIFGIQNMAGWLAGMPGRALPLAHRAFFLLLSSSFSSPPGFGCRIA